eukprot:1398747-Amphidinium_carterae.1
MVLARVLKSAPLSKYKSASNRKKNKNDSDAKDNRLETISSGRTKPSKGLFFKLWFRGLVWGVSDFCENGYCSCAGLEVAPLILPKLPTSHLIPCDRQIKANTTTNTHQKQRGNSIAELSSKQKEDEMRSTLSTHPFALDAENQ